VPRSPQNNVQWIYIIGKQLVWLLLGAGILWVLLVFLGTADSIHGAISPFNVEKVRTLPWISIGFGFIAFAAASWSIGRATGQTLSIVSKRVRMKRLAK
jgi:hypothetical protein